MVKVDSKIFLEIIIILIEKQVQQTVSALLKSLFFSVSFSGPHLLPASSDRFCPRSSGVCDGTYSCVLPDYSGMGRGWSTWV